MVQILSTLKMEIHSVKIVTMSIMDIAMIVEKNAIDTILSTEKAENRRTVRTAILEMEMM